MNTLIGLIKNNTGISCKSFFLVVVTFVCSILIITICFSIFYEEISNGYIKSDLVGLSALVGSISALLGAAGLTKVIGEKTESNNKN